VNSKWKRREFPPLFTAGTELVCATVLAKVASVGADVTIVFIAVAAVFV
jgi:hypothetical protein